MSSRTTLKSYFETGDVPTQSQFGEFIDSVPNITDDGSLAVYDYIIYKNGSNTVAFKTSDGTSSSNSDAATVIQAVLNALTSGGNIFIKAGTYTIATTLEWKASYQRIWGEGQTTILSMDGAAVTNGLKFHDVTYLACELHSIKFSNTNGINGTAILFNDSALCIYDNIYIKNFSVGLKITDSTNIVFYNTFKDFDIFTCDTCVDMGASGNPVNDNTFIKFRTDANANGYGLRIRSGSNGNAFYSFTAEPESITGTKGISIEGASFANHFYGTYIEANAVGVNIAAGCLINNFFGGIITGNTANISDLGYENIFLGVIGTGGVVSNRLGTFNGIDNSSSATPWIFQNNTNFAHVSSKLMLMQLLNGTDTSPVLQLKHNGVTAGQATALEFVLGNIQFDFVTKTQLVANTNDYAIGTGIFFRLSTDASRDITGIAGGCDGRMIVLRNVGAQNIVLKNNSGSSSSGNKFSFSTGADITIAAGGSITLMYDVTSAVWYDQK